MNPVAVLMPVHNAGRFLKDGIESILDQSFRDFRLLLVDDDSQDNSLRICEKYERLDRRIRFFRHAKCQGRATTFNDMLAAADTDTEFVAIAAARDLSEPERLQKQVEFLEANQDFAGIGSNIRFLDCAGHIIGECRYPLEPAEIRRHACCFCPLAHATFCFRYRLISAIGGYDPFFDYCDDYEFILRLLEQHYTLGNLPQQLVNVRHLDDLKDEVPQPRILLFNALRLQRYYLSRGQFLTPASLLHHLLSYAKLLNPQHISLYPHCNMFPRKKP